MDPRLDTGGWLALTETPYGLSSRQGLSPCKIRQAFPGAIRGRDTGYPVPPAQTRTCGFPASGSSVVLAFARIFTVTRYKTQLLLPTVRLAHGTRSDSVRHEFPLRATYFRQVLPHVAGFPYLRVLCLIRHPDGI